MVFFTYLQKERTDLLDFHAVGGDKWATVHGWLYYTGRVKDLAEFVDCLSGQSTAAGSGGWAWSPNRKLRETCTHAELDGDWGLGDGAKSPS